MIYTSYFASKKYNKKDGVSVARYCGFWKGDQCNELMPSASLLQWWKNLPKAYQEHKYYQEEYYKHYYEETLQYLNPHNIAADYDNKVLLCYEKTGEFCHRHLIAHWLKTYGYEVEEL